LRNADSVSEFKLNVKLNSKRKPGGDGGRPKLEFSLHPGLDEQKADDRPIDGPASFTPSPAPPPVAQPAV
jgi:hypothetical protein